MTQQPKTPPARASSFVRKDRLWQRHMDMARLGATAKGGVNRQALSAEDTAARALLTGWARRRGFSVFGDAIGNLFVVREGRNTTLPPVLCGSHLDTQPTGGKFDGAYGVLAALEVLEALDDGAIPTQRSVVAVAWTNEEGNRFQPGCMGSGTWAGVYSLEDMLKRQDPGGISVCDALACVQRDAPAEIRSSVGFPIAGYVEAHIEQGPILENTGNEIGVVNLIQGMRRYIVKVVGEESHSGTTPHAVRKDAMKAAAAIVLALDEGLRDPADIVRYTVGRFEVYPASPSTVPGRVQFIIDLRHPGAETLARLDQQIIETCHREAGKRGCTADVDNYVAVKPQPLAATIAELVSRHASGNGLKHMTMISGAGHDAMHIAKVAPAGMIFIPCLRGISHNEAESATPEDIANGAYVLADVVAEMASN